jgi:putative SbcD/Mre11-related phosphoesterase
MAYEFTDLGLFIDKEVLIFGDFHLGYEEMLNKKGVLIPRYQFKDTIKRLDKIFDRINPKIIVINGDLKHEFAKISEQEWRETLKLIDYLKKSCKRLILIKGNHDKIIEPIAKKKNIAILDEFSYKNYFITHGDILKDFKEKNIVISHEHPAITLEQGQRKETYKCFLIGKWQNKNLIVIPSFNLITEGMNVLEGKFLSPYLNDISDFNIYIVQDRIYDFGKIKALKS